MKKYYFIIVVASVAGLLAGWWFINNRVEKSENPDKALLKRDPLLGMVEPLILNPLTHAFIQIIFNDKIIYVDPADTGGKLNVFSLPKADYIFITHEHPDHWNKDFIKALRKDGTVIVGSAAVGEAGAMQFPGYRVMQNGEKVVLADLEVEALPAYNIVRKNDKGEFFHPQGRGNGYLFNLGGKKLYVAGDTECVPELDSLKDKLDILFLPMNLPFTMPALESAECALRLKPKVVYPYHQGREDPRVFESRVKEKDSNIDIRVAFLP